MKNSKENDIAVVGIACRFPGANTYQEFWHNIIENKNSIQEIPLERWDVERYYSDKNHQKNVSRSKWCGLINDPYCFDNDFFSISDQEAKQMDPQCRLLLQEVWKCVEDSSIPLTDLQRNRTAVFVGAMSLDYLHSLADNNLANQRHTLLGNDHSLLANRISHQFDFKGESLAINTASASSLVAIHKAKQSLKAGDCDFAIAAGVNLNLNPLKYIVFSQAGMLSPNGQCKAFSKDADGYVPGDGVAALLLQPLDKAIEQNNKIYAVIKGSAVVHNGHNKNITAPDVVTQESVIRAAIKDAGVSISDISYVESHGSGTPLGDPIEYEGLKRVFSESNRNVFIGSVKPNIGHLEACAGIAGVIKTILMMQYNTIPANINFSSINPAINTHQSNLTIALRNSQWQEKNIKCAGVSSYGLGGINSHLILQQSSQASKNIAHQPLTRQPAIKGYPFLLSAKSDSSLAQLVQNWMQFCHTEQFASMSLLDICANLSSRQAMPCRYGFWVNNKQDIVAGLESFTAAGVSCENHKKGKNSIQLDVNVLNEHELPWQESYQAVVDHALSTVDTIEQFSINTRFMTFTQDNQYIAFLMSGMINIKDYRALVSQEVGIEEVRLRPPRVVMFNASTGQYLYPNVHSEALIHAIFNELSEHPTFVSQLCARIKDIVVDHQQVVQSNLVLAGLSLEILSKPLATLNKHELIALCLSALRIINKQQSTWFIEVTFEQSFKLLPSLATLLKSDEWFRDFMLASSTLKDRTATASIKEVFTRLDSQLYSLTPSILLPLDGAVRQDYSFEEFVWTSYRAKNLDFTINLCALSNTAPLNTIENCLCDYWLAGNDINWLCHFMGQDVNKLSLPLYPFTQKVFSFDDNLSTLNKRLLPELNSEVFESVKRESFDDNIETQVQKFIAEILVT